MGDSQICVDKAKLRRRRILAGLDQAHLAKRAGRSQSHISLLERGKRGTTVRTLRELAQALHCEIADLLPDEEAA